MIAFLNLEWFVLVAIFVRRNVEDDLTFNGIFCEGHELLCLYVLELDEIQVVYFANTQRIYQSHVFSVFCFDDLDCAIHETVGELLSWINEEIQSGEKQTDLMGSGYSIWKNLCAL